MRAAGILNPVLTRCDAASWAAPMTDLFFIAVVLASFAAFGGFMRLLGRL
ncbi:hypothetical protein [Nannocystis punicea]|uniref:Uncharacterized protein n=1 Tax=Nannocystis punicea TaxID=2995304 RepID=A0ABY7HBF7_9BACT|nr:hypothetical protein [Nannocystis poenicansa]WAS96354.1 hypothetical protein O0S08_09355 [Nannocystis poenicansa]